MPVAILGSYQVRNWKRLNVPEGDRPVRRAAAVRDRPELDPRTQQQAADIIFARMHELHDELTRVGHRGAAQLARERAAARYDDERGPVATNPDAVALAQAARIASNLYRTIFDDDHANGCGRENDRDTAGGAGGALGDLLVRLGACV